MASAPAVKVPVYSGNDLKSTTDDSLAPYLTTLPQPYTFIQDHSKTNVRFVLGYTAVSIAAFTFYADRKLGWEATTSPWILAAVASYFILNTILTYWVWGVESGEIFRGKRQSGETISIRSTNKKFSPLYKLHIQYTSPSNKVLQEKEIETSFTTWFAADGTFHPKPLQQWISSEIEVLQLAAKELEKRRAARAGASVAAEASENSQDDKGAKRRK
ncbi:signal peptidase complex subunit spc2 [Aspergillus melleus]|uniref:Signal peptidase complex subunit spc2 n=1 Tax=Aspergillus melleus TaxID=138277 RepID=A0ACC3AZL3_9EURO|nr:signal peptidase complex subunit spc2 [Aspergillus melleus]